MKKIHPKESIRNLISYRPSVSDDKKTGVIRLSVNEGALGPSPKAIKELRKWALSDYFFHRYPDQINKKLIHAISSQYSLNPEQIVLGNGSDELIQLLSTAFIDSEEEAIYTEYGFLVFPQSIKIAGGKPIVAADKKFTVDVNEILKLTTNKTKLIFLANPNNPTGTYIKRKELLFLRKKLRSNILLVVDDAYFEYVKQKDFMSGLKTFTNFKNVVMTRTFSKIYGLAGLRVGWGYGSKEIISALNRIKPPFNVSRPALFAASAAVKDSSWLNKEINHVNKWNKKLFAEFKKMKIDTNKSFTNFLLVNFDRVKVNSAKVFKQLAKYGILVRKMDVYGIKNSLRITIGTGSENTELIKKMRKILNV